MREHAQCCTCQACSPLQSTSQPCKDAACFKLGGGGQQLAELACACWQLPGCSGAQACQRIGKESAVLSTSMAAARLNKFERGHTARICQYGLFLRLQSEWGGAWCAGCCEENGMVRAVRRLHLTQNHVAHQEILLLLQHPLRKIVADKAVLLCYTSRRPS